MKEERGRDKEGWREGHRKGEGERERKEARRRES